MQLLEDLRRVLGHTGYADNVWGSAQTSRKWLSSDITNVMHTILSDSNNTTLTLQFLEDNFELSTLDDHLNQLDEIEAGEKSKEYRINYRSGFLSLNYVDLCSGLLLPDVMHDVLEGALQHELKLLLQHCIFTQNYVQVNSLCDNN